MANFKPALLLSGIAIILASCAPTYTMDDAQFWQRSSATSAIYLDGPKAQQMLQRDVANCITEVRELTRLGVLRGKIPADTMQTGSVYDPRDPRGQIAEYQSPARDAYLYADDFEFHDFETCMIDKGWERMDHMPYNLARESRKEYLTAVRKQAPRPASFENVKKADNFN